MSPKSPPFNLIFCHRTNVKKSQRVPFFRLFGSLRQLKSLIFLFFFRKFSKESKESLFNCLKFCKFWCWKISKGPLFNGIDIVRFFKRYHFWHKIRFSQAKHAISDFFSRLVFFSKTLLNFYQKRNVLQELRTAQGFQHYAAYRRPSKFFLKNLFLNFLCFLRFSVDKIRFFCCFQLGKNGFRDLCVSLRVFFGAVKLMKL